MSKTLFTFLISELGTIRIACKKCRKVIEAKTADLIDDSGRLLKCPFCPADYNPLHENISTIQELAKSIVAAQKLDKIVEIEFVVPDGATKLPEAQRN